jgi:uncharacterized protein (TIGR01777 family)
MHALVTGTSGLLGRALVASLTGDGHRVTRLVRSESGEGTVIWDPESGIPDPGQIEGLDGAVHLAGESIARGRWTAAKKARIRDSRVRGTSLLCEALASLRTPPLVLVSASATGFYGDRGNERLHEESPSGSGFLPDVCREWEDATQPAVRNHIRVVNLRFGVVLSARGGALARMLLPFRLGLGGIVGNGRQYMSWISLEDAVGVIRFALESAALKGPVNTVSPNPVTNREFTKALGTALRRPTLFPMPAFAARLVFGELADALLLSSARVEPLKLTRAGYPFRHPELQSALAHLLGQRG